MKKWLKISLIVLAVLAVLFAASFFYSILNFCCGPDVDVDPNYFFDGVIYLKDYEYNNNGYSSHVCPKSWESVKFEIGGVEYIIEYSRAVLRQPYFDNEEEAAACGSTEGTPISLYEDKIINCTTEKVEGYGPPMYLYSCSGDLSFEILDSVKFNSCVSGKVCDLLHGVDVQFIPE